MRILIHGINFSPELTGIGKYTGEMAEWLAAQGHEVRVVTAPRLTIRSGRWRMGIRRRGISVRVLILDCRVGLRLLMKLLDISLSQ